MRPDHRRRPFNITLTLLLLSMAAGTSVALAGDVKAEQARARREKLMADLELQRALDPSASASRQRLAFTACSGGMAGAYPCLNVDLQAFLPTSQIGGGSLNDLWGWTDPLDGREYAIVGRTSGTSFVDISDPANPVYLGNLPPHGANSSWRDVKVYANYAYIVSEAFGHGMQIFDLTQLRTVASPPVTFSETGHYGNFGSAHNLAINEDTAFAYAVGTGTCSAGPHFIDLADPANPVYAGCHVEPIYTHDTQCVIYHGTDSRYVGREICINSNETTINVIDVTDKSAPVVLSQTSYAGWGYVHQGWLTEDHRYYMQGDELDEQQNGHHTRTRVFDMADLTAPVLINVYDAKTLAIDHNMYTHQGYLYQANYRAGLRILDLGAVSSGILQRVAYFDTYPSSDSAAFSGAWSVYPYFDSGNVIVSSIGEGLFVLRPQLPPDFHLSATPPSLQICDPDNAVSSISVVDRNGYTGVVNLSLSGLPLGAMESFSPAAVTAPGNSDLTVSAAGVAPGSYALTVSATDGTLTHETTVNLEVNDAVPGIAAPAMPPDGATGVSRLPLLTWSAPVQAVDYAVEVAADPAFQSIVFSASTSANSQEVMPALQPLTTYYWRVVAQNICGSGSYSPAASFTTAPIPPILVVDDDDNGPDVRADYTDALDALGRSYDVWDTQNSDSEPSAPVLSPYRTVIWFTGDEYGGAAGPGAGGETALAAWLNQSNCLLLASQDYYYDRGSTSFMQSYLGLGSATSDVGQDSATGQGTVFGGLGPYSFAFPYTNYTDTLDPAVGAATAFQGSVSSEALDKDTGVYRTTYWSFGLEGLPTPTDRETVLSSFLGWCDALDAIDGDADGVDNGTDCAAGDPNTWAAPSPARDLFLDAATGGLVWLAPSTPGATTPTYDVVRSTDPADFGVATCVEPGDTDTAATDAAMPAPGAGYYYLVRVSNPCGTNLGVGALGPRQAAVCP